MKKKLLSISILTLLISASVFAEVPADIAALADRDGVYKGSQDTSGAACKIVIEKGDENVDSLYIDSPEYFMTHVTLKDLKRTEKNGVATYETNQPGTGSTCGHYPLLSYKKTMIVTKTSLTVKQVFRCLLDWSATTTLETCTVK
jgi:hypothetical protein